MTKSNSINLKARLDTAGQTQAEILCGLLLEPLLKFHGDFAPSGKLLSERFNICTFAGENNGQPNIPRMVDLYSHILLRAMESAAIYMPDSYYARYMKDNYDFEMKIRKGGLPDYENSARKSFENLLSTCTDFVAAMPDTLKISYKAFFRDVMHAYIPADFSGQDAEPPDWQEMIGDRFSGERSDTENIKVIQTIVPPFTPE